MLTCAGLFAGIGGIELGFQASGIRTQLLCEIDAHAQAVLRAKFPDITLESDVRGLKSLPRVDVVAAGFPCQDLSQAGRTAGIRGHQSGLIDEVFRLISGRRVPRWVVLENVPFMLQLDRGRAMQHLVERLEALRYRWAYRVVDTRAFGLPQRRQRVILVASRTEDPRDVLFADEAEKAGTPSHKGLACGFYWTEGTRGLGWAVDAIPTLKGGSTIGIPSPPAIWRPDGQIVTPHICDAERLQGFAAEWTLPALTSGRKGPRWKLVGNAVSVPVAEWLGFRLSKPGTALDLSSRPLVPGSSWPTAASGYQGRWVAVNVSMWPVRRHSPHLVDFLQFESPLLSAKASVGFLYRAKQSKLRFVDGFLDAVAFHARRMEGSGAARKAKAVA